MSKDVVGDFVAAYAREFDYYQAAARLCYQRCEAILAARGIRAIVTYRAKRPSKLLAKLMQRDQARSNETLRFDTYADKPGTQAALRAASGAALSGRNPSEFSVADRGGFRDSGAIKAAVCRTFGPIAAP